MFSRQYSQPNAFEKISIFCEDGIHFIKMRDIIRCEAEDNYTHIHLCGGKRITSAKTLKSYEDMLRGLNFYRVHKRHLVNLNFTAKFVKSDGGYLIMEDGTQINVSRRRRPELLQIFKQAQNTARNIIVTALDSTYRITVQDIIRCEAVNTNTIIHLRSREHIKATAEIQVYEDLLTGNKNFYRVHKRHLVNLSFVENVLKGDECYLIMKDGKMIEISPDKLDPFL